MKMKRKSKQAKITVTSENDNALKYLTHFTKMAPVSCMFQRLFLHDNSFTTKLKMVASNKEPGFQDMEKKTSPNL